MSKPEHSDYNRENPLAERSKGLFLEKLDTVQSWLSDNGIAYRILGSLAVSAYLDPSLKKMDFNRMGGFSSDQKVPDIDLLVKDRMFLKYTHTDKSCSVIHLFQLG